MAVWQRTLRPPLVSPNSRRVSFSWKNLANIFRQPRKVWNDEAELNATIETRRGKFRKGFKGSRYAVYPKDSDQKASATFTANNRYKNARQAQGDINAQMSSEEAEKPHYEKVGNRDYEFIDEMVEIKSKKHRDRKNKFLVEGKRLVTDALLAGLELELLLFTNAADLEDMPLVEGEGKIQRIGVHRIQTWSSLVTPPGTMAIFKKPKYQDILDKQERDAIPLTVICDNIREPGNMGSVLRCLSAVGCSRTLVVKQCCDVWESKVLRGGMGAHFRLPLYTDLTWDQVEEYLPENFSLFLADSESFEDQKGTINTEGNVSASFRQNIPVMNYADINFGLSTPVVLVIGGETHGLSKGAQNLARKKSGTRIHIPMCQGVNSLNTAVAVGIVVFEIRKQILSHR